LEALVNKELKKDIDLFCHATVGTMFATFQNPRYVGPEFSWDKFPEMMEDMCRNNCGVSVDPPRKLSKMAEQYAATLGKVLAEEFVRIMTQE